MIKKRKPVTSCKEICGSPKSKGEYKHVLEIENETILSSEFTKPKTMIDKIKERLDSEIFDVNSKWGEGYNCGIKTIASFIENLEKESKEEKPKEFRPSLFKETRKGGIKTVIDIDRDLLDKCGYFNATTEEWQQAIDKGQIELFKPIKQSKKEKLLELCEEFDLSYYTENGYCIACSIPITFGSTWVFAKSKKKLIKKLEQLRDENKNYV